MNKDLGILQFGAEVKEFLIAMAEGFKHHRHVVMQDFIPPACGTQNKASADVTIIKQAGLAVVLFQFCQHIIAHQPGIQPADLFLVVRRADGQELLAGAVGGGQGIAARQLHGSRECARFERDMQLFGI